MKNQPPADVGIINVHTHPFTDEDCPYDGPSDMLEHRHEHWLVKLVIRFLSRHRRSSSRGIYSLSYRMASFQSAFLRDSQDEMMHIEDSLLEAAFLKIAAETANSELREWLEKHPSRYHVGLLLKFGEAGFKGKYSQGRSDEESYRLALNIARKGKLKGKFTPGLGIDPRDPEMMKKVEAHWENGCRVYKLYPALGFRVDDRELIERFYPWAQERGAAIVAHCSPGGFWTNQNPIQISWVDETGKRHSKRKYFKGKAPWLWFAPWRRKYFNNPKHWRSVLRRFPELKINLAHLGGDKEIHKFARGRRRTVTGEIITLCQQYPNVMSDISYSGFKRGIDRDLKKLLICHPFMKERIMFGDDHSLVRMRSYILPELEALTLMLLELEGFELFKKLFYSNAAGFLFDREG